jgi:CheY-like chemotaxis protein
MLVPTDYEITEAEDGEQTREAITKQRPDLILMDIQLPIIDGYTATRKIKANPAWRSRRRVRPVVMIMFRSPSAHVSYWPKSGSTRHYSGVNRCSA